MVSSHYGLSSVWCVINKVSNLHGLSSVWSVEQDSLCSTARLFMGTASGGSGDGHDNHLNVDNDNDGGD